MDSATTKNENDDELASKQFVVRTYKVTILMLIVGAIQVSVVMEIIFIKRLLKEHYYLSVLQFFISFLSIQLYVFFFHVLIKLASWKRLLAGLWTFEMNTISIMKPAKKGHFVYLVISWLLTVGMMIVSVVYGEIAIKHQRGLFIKRHNVIRWSERIFVLTSFGIIVCSETNRVSIEFPTLLSYCLMSNIFVIIFAASMRRPGFYHMDSEHDPILIGQLYYLNCYALFMGYVWTMKSGVEIFGDVIPH